MTILTIYLGVTGAISFITGFISILMLEMCDPTELSLLPWHLSENSEKLNWFGVTVVTLIHIALVPFLFVLHFIIWVIYKFCMLCVNPEYRR